MGRARWVSITCLVKHVIRVFHDTLRVDYACYQALPNAEPISFAAIGSFASISGIMSFW